MNCEVVVLPEFAKEAKQLAKKFRKIKDDLHTLIDILSKDPKAGTPLERHCYKIRLGNSSIPTGKRGGFRVIYYFVDTSEETVYLMSIYSKTEQSTISDLAIMEILKNNGLIDR